MGEGVVRESRMEGHVALFNGQPPRPCCGAWGLCCVTWQLGGGLGERGHLCLYG